MILRGRLLPALGLILCLIGSLARADMFGLSVESLKSTFDGTTFTAWKTTGDTGSTGTITRYETPSGKTRFFWDIYATGDFSLSMTVTGIVGFPTYTANGAGSFIFTDVDGDTITGKITGHWDFEGADEFHGALSNVTFTDNGFPDGTFNGHLGSVSMSFAAAAPWRGGITNLVAANAPWFDVPWSTNGYLAGSADLTVVPVPIPAAVLLGFLGLGTAGAMLRKCV